MIIKLPYTKIQFYPFKFTQQGINRSQRLSLLFLINKSDLKLEESLDYDKKELSQQQSKKFLGELKILAKNNMEKNTVIKQDYLKKHHDRKETFNTFPLKLQWHERSCPGCLSFATI